MLIGAVGYLAFVKKYEPVVRQPTPTPIQTKIPKRTPITKDETANWKTFINIPLGFEAKYPQTWSVRVENGIAIFNLPDDSGWAIKEGVSFSIPVAITVSRDSKKYSSLSDLENFFKSELLSNPSGNYSGISQKTIGNNNFLVYSWMHQAQGVNYLTYINGNSIEISFYMGDTSLSIEHSINYADFLKFLTTLQFTQ